MVDKVISENYEDIVEDLVNSNRWIMHEYRSQGIEDFNNGVKEIFVPRMII